MKPHERIGPIARQLAHLFDAWIIGSSVDYVSGISDIPPRDLDIIVPLHLWTRACKLVPKFSVANSFGGFKFMDDGMEVDVWPDDLGTIFLNGNTIKAYQLAKNITVSRI